MTGADIDGGGAALDEGEEVVPVEVVGVAEVGGEGGGVAVEDGGEGGGGFWAVLAGVEMGGEGGMRTG